jgi:hypothetical protein
MFAKGWNTLRSARLVKRVTGKSLASQALEIVRLHFGRTRLGPGDYYALDLFDEALSFRDKSRFVGWRASAEIDSRLNAAFSRVLANDKIVNYQLLGALGFPMPRTIATYSKTGRAIGTEIRLSSLEAVRSFLRSANFPMFAKPVAGTYGRGAASLAGFDPHRSVLRLAHGAELPEDTFFAQLDFAPFNGYLFQEVVRPHQSIVDVAGPAASCIRVGVLTDPIPVVHFAFWKIATNKNVTDNFSRGTTGNLLGAIHLSTGKITDALAAPGPNRKRITVHPSTGRGLIGFEIPMWKEVIEMSTTVARHFPGLRLQNWDVVVTNQGPLLMELNTEADLFAVNLLSRVGVLNGRLADLMSERGDSDVV